MLFRSEWTQSAPTLSSLDAGTGIGPEAVDAITQGLSGYAAEQQAATSAPIEHMVAYLLNKGVDPTPALENARRMSDYQSQLDRASALRDAYGPLVDNPILLSLNRTRP